MDMKPGHAALACRMDMQHGEAAWTCSIVRGIWGKICEEEDTNVKDLKG
jgi:hypothetical protein